MKTTRYTCYAICKTNRLGLFQKGKAYPCATFLDFGTGDMVYKMGARSREGLPELVEASKRLSSHDQWFDSDKTDRNFDVHTNIKTVNEAKKLEFDAQK